MLVEILPKYEKCHFQCRRYYVDTVGKNGKKIQEYILNQLKEDWKYDLMTFKEYIDLFTGESVKASSGGRTKPVVMILAYFLSEIMFSRMPFCAILNMWRVHGQKRFHHEWSRA